MGNLIDMEDELVFPDFEAMKDWLRKNAPASGPEELQLPIPEREPERYPVESDTFIIDLS